MSVSVDLHEVLQVCVRSALAAQQYIALDLLKLSELQLEGEGARGQRASSILALGETQKQQLLRALNDSVAVDVKAELDYKEGEASHDLVTTADVLTQAVIVKALSTTFPSLPFTIVGEEEPQAAEKDAAMAAKMNYCLAQYYSGNGKDTAAEGQSSAVPAAEALTAHLARQQSPRAKGVVAADSLEALRQRVTIYIDPIDGTNCFVTGVWQSPMTLIGITVDGVPLAAVMNRVFLYPIGNTSSSSNSTAAASLPPAQSISYVWNVAPDIVGSAFMVHEGQRVPPKTTVVNSSNSNKDREDLTDTATLCVAQSSTTKASFLAEVSDKLAPAEAVLARGAGNKLFALIEKSLARSYGVQQRRYGETVHADAFICPGHTIKKWDTCAPHAFLYALGGDIFSYHGAALRYPLKAGDDVYSAAFAELPDGIVAVRKEALPTVAHRLGWPTPASL